MFEYLIIYIFFLQSKTPALVFEYINNTDFKVRTYFFFLLAGVLGWVVAISTADSLEHEGGKVIGESRKSHIGFLLA